MPTSHGIKLTIVSASKFSRLDFGIFPEFPHPDSSQFTNRSTCVGPRRNSEALELAEATSSKDSKADQLLGKETGISVYIPSLPEIRFWIRYQILEPPRNDTPFLYFKVFMNGRAITSTGCNAHKTKEGQIMRALFDPDPSYNYQDANGVHIKANGLERRAFFFTPRDEESSIGNDGGLIEIRVFRAEGGQRRLQEPPVFKDQEECGLRLISGGLVDRPQDAKFYDFCLSDHTDEPYAVFKFHYRSWDSLIESNLAPSPQPRKLLPITPSLLDLFGLSLQQQELLDEKNFAKYERGYKGRNNGAADENEEEPRREKRLVLVTKLEKDESESSDSDDEAMDAPKEPAPSSRLRRCDSVRSLRDLVTVEGSPNITPQYRIPLPIKRKPLPPPTPPPPTSSTTSPPSTSQQSSRTPTLVETRQLLYHDLSSPSTSSLAGDSRYPLFTPSTTNTRPLPPFPLRMSSLRALEEEKAKKVVRFTEGV